jgi:phosphoglycolate phosphatase-like HAD superfamily hydrolase
MGMSFENVEERLSEFLQREATVEQSFAALEQELKEEYEKTFRQARIQTTVARVQTINRFNGRGYSQQITSSRPTQGLQKEE